MYQEHSPWRLETRSAPHARPPNPSSTASHVTVLSALDGNRTVTASLGHRVLVTHELQGEHYHREIDDQSLGAGSLASAFVICSSHIRSAAISPHVVQLTQLKIPKVIFGCQVLTVLLGAVEGVATHISSLTSPGRETVRVIVAECKDNPVPRLN